AAHPVGPEHERQTEQAQDHNVTGRDGGEQTYQQGKRLCKYSYKLNRQDNNPEGEGNTRCPEDVTPVIPVAAKISDQECEERKRHRPRDVSRKVRRARQKAEEVTEQDKEERRQHVRQIRFVFRADVRLYDFVPNKQDYRLHEGL